LLLKGIVLSTIDFLPLSSPVISTNGGGKLYFQVTNRSNETLNLYWVDQSGKLVSYGSIPPGATRMQDTSSTHVWELASDDGKVGFKFLTSTPGDIQVGGDFQPVFTSYEEKIIQTPDGLWSTAMGYGLINVEASLGVPHAKELPMNGQNNYAALNAIQAPSAWAAGITGKGVKVAVVDSGIATHAEIGGKIVGGYDFQDRDSDPSPDNGAYRDHSLGVAAIIAASHDPQYGRDTMGVAPDAQLLNVRVGSSQGSSSANMAAGIRWAVDNGAKVICMPLQSNSPEIDQAVRDAVHYAFQHNVVTVVIGGNFSSFNPTGPALIGQSLKGELIDVGNYDIMSGSPFASSNQPGTSPFPWVMASSTGWVPNPDGGYTYFNDGGTSFAGPYVAGLAALLWQQNPNATAAEIIRKITAGADLGNSKALGEFEAGHAGTPAADIVTAVSGISYDLGGGVDLLKLAGAKTAYTITHNSDGSWDVANTTDHSVNHLANVERLQFSDATLALDTGKGELAGEVYRLYQAAFKRTPDQSGLSFWLDAIDHGTPLEQIARDFVGSSEFKGMYGASPANADLVNAMYANVLHRAPDAEGLAFWLDGMNHGLSAASLLAQFSESQENIANLAKLIGQGFAYTPYS
jgi:subtilisin family serine protease